MRRLIPALAVPLTCAQLCGADIVINEIHYAPPEKTDHTEFVELYNTGSNSVDLAGWRMSGGIDFTFPSNTFIGSGAFLVLSEDPAAASNRFGIASLGPFSGYLDNDGERIRLRNAADLIADEVDYGVAFPWPTACSGEGASMELVHPALDNDLGGSWRSSGYPGVGLPTPGRTNSVWATTAPPQARQVAHEPLQPATSNTVTVTVKVTDPNGVAAVELAYQVVLPGAYLPAWKPLERDVLMSAPNTPFDLNPEFTNQSNWTRLTMCDDGTTGDATAGDDVYSVVLPAQPVNRTLVRYRITARDARGAMCVFPYADDPSLNFAFFVCDGVPAYAATNSVYGAPHVYDREVMSSLPVYHLLTRNDDLMHCYAYDPAYSAWQIPVGNEDARDRFNWEGAFVYEGIVHDHIRYRLRQRNDRYFGYGKRSMRFRFNQGCYFQARDEQGHKLPQKWRTLNTGKMSRFNAAGNFGLSEYMNQALWDLVGVPCTTMHHFHFRVVDGPEEAPAGADGQYEGDFHGYYLGMEDYDPRFLAARNLPDGNMYKLKDGVSDPAELQRNQGRCAVTDGSDFDVIHDNLRPERDAAWIRQHVNVELWYPYHAICEAVRHYDFDPADSHLKNRVWFFEPSEDPLGRLWILPHDSDASWIRGYHDGSAKAIGIDYTKQAIFDYADGFGANAKPALKQEYRNSIREIRDLLWREDVIVPMIDALAARLAEWSRADRDRWKDAPADAGYQDFGPMEDWVAAMKAFAFEEDWIDGAAFSGGRAAYLDQFAAAEGDAGAVPDTPTIAYAGISNYPLNGLTFTCSEFSDPQGDDTFSAMRWRVGEITDTNAPGYDERDVPRFEITPVWQSDLLTNFMPAMTVPASSLKVGHTYRARARMRDNTGRWSHWSLPVTFTTGEPDSAVTLLAALRVTEVMAHPPGGDARRDCEFIELQNRSTNTLSLAGVRFSDGIDFTFGDVTLAAGAYVLVVRNAAAFSQAYNTNGLRIAGEYGGALANEGERVKLRTAASGTTIVLFEYGSGRGWPPAADGAGHSLVPLVMDDQLTSLNYGGNWRASAFIGGSPGRADPELERSVVVNEFAAHTDYTAGEPWQDSNDWIELFNAGETAAAFDGHWYLSDSADALMKWPVAAGVLPPGEWITFYEVGGFHSSPDSGFGLNKAGEAVFLSYLPGTAADRVVDCVRFKGQRNGLTEGRYPDGANGWFALSPTTNAANALPEGHVVLDEVMYHPASDTNILEYVELHNPTDAAVPLWREESLAWEPGWSSPWRLAGGIAYAFPSNTVFAPRERFLVVGFDPTNSTYRSRFAQVYGLTNQAVRLFGPWSGALSDQGERVAVEAPVAPDEKGEQTSWEIVDEIIYSDHSPWPHDADGGGRSLQRAANSGWGNDFENWDTGVKPTPGLPPVKVNLASPGEGRPFVLPCTIALRADVDPKLVVGAVARVTFRAENTPIGEVTTMPYELSFSPAPSNATYRLDVVLEDAAGAYTSTPVTVSVYTNAPRVTAGHDRVLNAREYDSLELEATIDPNGLPDNVIHTFWQVLSGPGLVSFADAGDPHARVRFSTAGTYSLGYVATYGGHTSTSTVAVVVLTSNTTNALPYTESFERYDSGRSISGVAGWSANHREAALVTAQGSGATAEVPILDDTHGQSLAVAGEVVNQFEGRTRSNAWFDVLLTANLETRPRPSDLEDPGQFALTFDPEGRMRMWQGLGGSNSWLVLPDVTVTNGQWVRVTIHKGHSGATNGFRVWVDGAAITNPTTFFPSANPGRTGFDAVEFKGEYLVDDLVVDDYDVLNYRKVTASAHGSGGVSPEGDVLVPLGADAALDLVASNYYHAAIVDVDGATVWTGHVAQLRYAFSNVVSRHWLDVSFRENLATNGTPEWWLANANPAWTNAFDRRALDDYDGDGMATWEEYVAGTHPTNGDDVLHLHLVTVATNGTYAAELSWETRPGRSYGLYATTSLVDGVWHDLLRTGGSGARYQHLELESDGHRPRHFYRLGVSLQGHP